MKSHYKQAMDSLSLSPEASSRIQAELCRPRRRMRFRPAAVVAAVLILALGTTAMASGIFNHDIPAAIAQSLEPVQLSSTSQDITMTVQSAVVEDGVFSAYITMEDEQDGGRLAQGVDFYDSYQINTPYRASEVLSGYLPLGYDEQSGSYGFLIQIQAKDGDGRTLDFSKDKFTFSVRQLMLGQMKREPELSLDWSSLPAEVQTEQKYCLGGSHLEGYTMPQRHPDGMVDFLQSGTMDIPVTDGVTITAGGFLDGRLHLLLRYDNAGPDDHGWFRLVSPEDGRTDISTCVSMNYREEDGSKFQELIYDVTPEDLEGRVLSGEFTTGGCLLDGNWKVTFTLRDGE